MPSSHGELTLQLETRTLRQQSISIPSRSVSIFRLSMVRLSTPVARMPKWPALQDGEVAQNHIVAVLEGDGLIAHAGSLGPRSLAAAPAETLAPNRSRAQDCEVPESFAPHQAIVPVIVSIVLVILPRCVGLGGVVAGAAGHPSFGHCSGEYCRPLVQIKRDLTLQMDGIAGIDTWRKADCSSSRGAGGFDRFVNGGGIDGGRRRLWRRRASRRIQYWCPLRA